MKARFLSKVKIRILHSLTSVAIFVQAGVAVQLSVVSELCKTGKKLLPLNKKIINTSIIIFR
jgi:hypothetical protein